MSSTPEPPPPPPWVATPGAHPAPGAPNTGGGPSGPDVVGHDMVGGIQRPVGQPLAAPSAPPRPPRERIAVICTWLSALSVVGVLLGLSITEDGNNQWHFQQAWGGFALLAAALTGAPLFATQLKWTARRAWSVAVAGGVGLAFHWILFTLPSISDNTALLATIGAGCGVAAAWFTPTPPADRQP